MNALIIIGAVILILAIAWWFLGNHKTVAAQAESVDGVQKVAVDVNGGYSPSTIVLKKGVPAEVTFTRNDASECLAELIAPELGWNEHLPEHEAHAINIDTSKAGEFGFACGMNMFHGKIVVE